MLIKPGNKQRASFRSPILVQPRTAVKRLAGPQRNLVQRSAVQRSPVKWEGSSNRKESEESVIARCSGQEETLEIAVTFQQ